MSTDSNRDQSTDRMLTAALRQHSAGRSGESCVDAETLAAWAEGALPEALAQQVEAHLADCARCQSVMAAFVASDFEAAAAVTPDAAPVVVPFRPRSPMQTMRWLIPAAAGTIAATLLIWTAWPRPDATVVGTDQTLAKAAESLPQPAAVAPVPAPMTSPMPQFGPARPSPVGAQPRGSVGTLASPRSTAAVANDARKEQKAITQTQQMARQEAVTVQQGARADTAVKPTPAAPPPPPPPPVYVPPPPPPAIGAAAARSSTVAGLPGSLVNVSIPAAVLVEFAPPDLLARGPVAGRGGGGGGGGRGAGGAGGGRASVALAERASPLVRWRIMTSGQVEKSIDAGATWVPVVLDPPASVGNGAAPSTNVCWLIGRAGVVLLSTDGARFTRVPFPESTDLRSITAMDARQATVGTVDGRVFTTTDGGQTWK